jgi:flagellum-specific peptidoglycan hydrolase FlgJ
MQPMKSEPEIVNKGNCIKEVAEHKGEKPKKVKSTGIFSTRTWRPDGAKNQIDYVERFHQVAQEEQKQFGIPASITLAQAIVESNNGESNLCKATNNHFGIKCFSTKCAKGHCKNFKDDSHKDFFRCYSSAWMSFREHSKFLSAHKYKKYNGLSAKEWCNGLKENGYATDSDYADRLYSIIVQLDLEFYDL